MSEERLPEGWVWTRLDEVIDKVPLTDRKLKQSEYQEKGKIPVIDQGQTFIGGYSDKEELKVKVNSEIPVIIFGDHTKVFKYVNFDFIAGADGVKVMRPQQAFYPKLFYYFIQAIRLPDKGYARHFQFLEKSSVPLPPLPKQRAIVSKIEQLFSDLDNGIENFKQAQAQLKRYRQSVLKAACEGKLVPTEAELAREEGRDYEVAGVLLARILKERREKWNGNGKYKEPAAPDKSGELSELAEGWGWASIDQVSHYIVDCLHSTPKFVPVGMYCIDTNCIEPAKILFDKARFVSEETYNERVSRLVPQPDDILFAREGTIGTAVIVPQNTRLCLGQRMMMFRAANGVIPLYFMWALQSQIFETQWKIKVLGTTVPHVNIGDIKFMSIPLPPTLEQRRIVLEVERRLSLCGKLEETITESLQKAESLRQSILKKAFEGKLLNKKELEKARNAPDWEPAEKLLERIKADKNNTKMKLKDKK